MSAALRPMRAEDVDAVRDCAVAAFTGLAATLGEPVPESADSPQQEMFRAVYRHLHRTDPDGCVVAEQDGRVVGVALAHVRADLWGLALLVVAPQAQGAGLGRQLLDAALVSADGCARGVISSSRSPAAMRRYLGAGFALHPCVSATGTVRADRLAPVHGVREGLERALADEVDLEVRGARRGADHDAMAAYARPFSLDGAGGRGYAYLAWDGDVVLAATDPATAQALLVTCLAARAGEKASVRHLTAEQQWALPGCLDAGLALSASGPLFYRGTAPPAPYLPSGLFL